jgi:YVTN family beta-propeller protein
VKTVKRRLPTLRRAAAAAVALAVAVLAAGCSEGAGDRSPAGGEAAASPAAQPAAVNVYAGTGPGDLSPAVAGVPSRVYVPNSEDNTVDVIDPATYRVVSHFPVGKLPQHVTPSWDLKTLYVDNDVGNSLTPIDPRTGEPGPTIPVIDPYNLYFTLDGTWAVVVAEARRRLDFRDPHTWAVVKSVPVPCKGVDHGDFTVDGSEMVLSCEFSGQLLRLDVKRMEITGTLKVGGSPVDVRISPDGTVFYVANQKRHGVSVIDAHKFKEIAFIPTGKGAHGLYPSRDATSLYVSNRLGGTVSVISFATRSVTATWTTGGSPDMGGVTTDGSQLWLSGRYDGVVYVIDTRTGTVLHRIPVGRGAHGLCVFPQPGRLSLGHTGNFR